MNARTAMSDALLAAQRRLRDARIADAIAEMRRIDPPGCAFCGEGPTEGRELRMEDASPNSAAEMTCRACFERHDRGNDFTRLPLVWAPINGETE